MTDGNVNERPALPHTESKEYKLMNCMLDAYARAFYKHGDESNMKEWRTAFFSTPSTEGVTKLSSIIKNCKALLADLALQEDPLLKK